IWLMMVPSLLPWLSFTSLEPGASLSIQYAAKSGVGRMVSVGYLVTGVPTENSSRSLRMASPQPTKPKSTTAANVTTGTTATQYALMVASPAPDWLIELFWAVSAGCCQTLAGKKAITT